MVDRRLTHMSVLDTPGLRAAARAAAKGPTSSTVVGKLLAVESSPAWRTEVDVLGGVVVLGANPGAYVVGGGVYVAVEDGRPTWVTGPTDQEVPYSEGPSTVREGAKPFVLNPAAVIDQGARDEANEVITKIGLAFVTSLEAPTPEDGEGRPNGAIWTRTDPDGTPAARWRWDTTEGAWVSVPVDEVAIFSEAFIDTLATNTLLAQRLTLTSEVDGWLTQVSGRGLETFRPDGVAAIQLGNFGENYLQLSTDDDVVGVALDQSGGVNAINGSFNESLRYQGVELAEYVESAGGKGVIAWGGVHAGNFSVITAPGGERALFEIAAEADASGRYWEFSMSPIMLRVGGSGNVGIRLRYTDDGSTPGLGSPIWAYDQKTTNWSGDGFVTCHIPMRPITPTAGRTYRLLVNMYSNGPGLAVENAPGNTVWARIADLGALTEQSFTVRSDYVARDATPPTPPPTTVKKRYVNDTLGRAWHKVWEQGGGSPAAIQGTVLQGRTPYYPAAGIYRSMVGFPSLTGKLTGAAIESIQVMVRAEHWYSHAGGRIDIGLHGATSAPGGFQESHHAVASARLGVGGSTWITIPREYYAGFRDGTYRGITVFRNSADPVDYGKFTPSEFRIRATYVK